MKLEREGYKLVHFESWGGAPHKLASNALHLNGEAIVELVCGRLCVYLKEESAPAWNGEGLPPVGADVECTFAVEDQRIWHRGTVVYRGVQPEGDDFIVVKTDQASACYREGGGMVRPHRTPEQIEAEERKAAIEDMVISLGRYETIHDACEMLYEAGYRKQVAP